MLNSLSGNAIDAKARAIYGKRLTPANYHELVRRRSVTEVALYLKNTPRYGKYLSSIGDGQVHRGQLEDLLQKTKLHIYTSFCHYDFSKARRFYRFVVNNSEIALILHSIILINTGYPEKIIPELPTFMEGYFSFDFMRLSQCHSYKDLLELLSDTPYYKVLKPLLTANEINLADCELALKSLYYKMLLHSAKHDFSKKEAEMLREITLMEAELTNFSLIYRLKFFQKLPPEEIKRRLLPFRLKLNDAAIEKLVSANTDEAFISAMPVKSGKHSMSSEFEYIEQYTKKLRYILCRRSLRDIVSAPVAYFAIMALTQIEIENITVIIEGIRYGASPDEIEKLLIQE